MTNKDHDKDIYYKLIASNSMRYFSTFSGIGGFELGILQAYENNFSCGIKNTSKRKETSNISEPQLANYQSGSQHKRNQPNINGKRKSVLGTRRPQCIGYSEINPYAISIYQKHFPEHTNYGDIKAIDPKQLPNFDLLVGGFPCQPFSLAGKRKGFNDIRGTLFFEIARIIGEKQPSFLLLENVKGLLSHNQGHTFATILTTLSELGYDLQWQVINSKTYVPQNRERIFIIGHLRGKNRPKIFPFFSPEKVRSQPRPKEERIYTGTLTARQFANWNGNFIRENQNQIRRLTPLECERLQGFTDGWTAKGIIDGKKVNISDTQRYKVLGNAVTVNVIKAIFKRLMLLESV